MTYKGRVRNGTIVLDPPAELPDGAEVIVQWQEPNDVRKDRPLMKYVGQATDLPPNASMTIDQQLYGDRP